MSFLSILKIKPLSGVSLANMFSHTVGSLHFNVVFFSRASAFYFDEIPFVYSFLYVPCSRVCISENIAAWNIWDFPTYVLLWDRMCILHVRWSFLLTYYYRSWPVKPAKLIFVVSGVTTWSYISLALIPDKILMINLLVWYFLRRRKWDSKICICLSQGCQTHFHQGPHQPPGCLQRAKCNFRTE